MNRSPAFQFYPDKWQSHTRRLSDSAYRVYHELICWMWRSSEDYCSIQNSSEAVACAVAMQTECVRIALAEIQNPFAPLLKEEDGRLVSNGLRKARQAQENKSEKAKRSADARWKDANALRTHGPSNAEKSNPQCFPTPTPTPTPTPIIEEKEVAALPTPASDALKETKRFKAPSLEEVKLQCSKIGLAESEAERFLNYHASRGWVVGKAPMKNWHFALNTWKMNAAKFKAESSSMPSRFAAKPTRADGEFCANWRSKDASEMTPKELTAYSIQ